MKKWNKQKSVNLQLGQKTMVLVQSIIRVHGIQHTTYLKMKLTSICRKERGVNMRIHANKEFNFNNNKYIVIKICDSNYKYQVKKLKRVGMHGSVFLELIHQQKLVKYQKVRCINMTYIFALIVIILLQRLTLHLSYLLKCYMIVELKKRGKRKNENKH